MSSWVQRTKRATWIVAAITLSGAAPAHAAPLTLDQLIAMAKQVDPRLKAAKAEIADLRGKEKEAYWAWFPKFETTIGLGGPIPEARNNGLGGPPTTAASYEYDADLGNVGFTTGIVTSAILPIYTFGKISALREAGKQGPIIGEALKERQENETVGQVEQAFFGFQIAREGVATLQDARKELDKTRDRIQSMLDKQSDQVTHIDLLKVDYFRQVAEAKQAEAESHMEIALQGLRLITGTPANEPIELVKQDLPAPNYELRPLEDYLRLAEQNRPELRAADAGLVAKRAELLIRKREYYPDFGILGFFNFQYTSSATRQRSPFAYDPYNVLTSGIGLVMHMTFDLPVKSAHVDQAEAQLQKLEAQREAIADGIRLEVATLRANVVEAQTRGRTYAAAEKNARQWTLSAVENFELGVGDTRELVDGFVSLGQAAGERLRAWRDAELDLRALGRAVGIERSQVVTGKQ